MESASASSTPIQSSTLSNSVSCAEFIQSYPFPAFLLSRRSPGKFSSPLFPVYSNKAWKRLIFGPLAHISAAETGGLLESIPDPDGPESIHTASRLGKWIDAPQSAQTNTFLLPLKPSWFGPTQPPVQLELVKTPVDRFWVITSIPRSSLPQFQPVIKGPYSSTSGIRREASANLKLHDFASLIPRAEYLDSPGTPFFTPMGGPISLTSMIDSPSGIGLDPDSEMARMLADYPWETSALGPISQWPQSLRTALSYIMGTPFPMAIWWGPELTLLYNDGYREIAGSKHPWIFGKSGSIAWGEIWNEIGPPAMQIMNGERTHIAKSDDLLLFHRLTKDKLPEELYHTWHWVAAKAEDDKIGGIINGTLETTNKVIANRRILLLRDLCDSLVLAPTKLDYAEALFKVFSNHPIDIPFALLYYSTVEAAAKPATGIASLSSAAQYAPQHVRVSLHKASSFGIPPDHAATPELIEILLQPGSRYPVHVKSSMKGSIFSPLSGSSSHGSTDNTSSETPSENWEMDTINTSSNDTERLSHTSQWPLFGAFGLDSVLHVEELPAQIANSLLRLGWGDKPREAVVIQIAPQDEDIPSAFLVLGLNTRRPYDKDYQTWVEVLRMTLSSTLSATMSREAEKLKSEQLAQLDAAKTTFFSSASHELRTPLTLIQGPLNDLLTYEHQDSRVKDLLRLASRNVARLSRLVDSLMQFTRLEAGRLQGQFSAIHLDAFTADLCSLFRGTIEKSNIEFVVEIHSRQERVVYVDPDFWEKIVFNLIGNAFKYTMDGKITVKLQYDDKYCKFIVQDTGVGVPEEDIQKIFERFHRVASTSRSHEGTGIGLSLTQQLVKLHNGEISVKSRTVDPDHPELPHGSTFTVTIPLGKEHLSRELIDENGPELAHQRAYAKSIIDEASKWGATRGSDESTPSESSFSSGSGSDGQLSDLSLFSFSKKDVILVVDDNSDVKTYIRSIFGRLCTVVEASNGQEALDIVRKGPGPDLIISDVMMPVLDGYGLLRSLKDNALTHLIPVILLTAKAGEEAKLEGLLSGADDYIAKPFRSKELVARAHLQLQIGKRKMEMQRLFDQRTQEMMVLSDMSPVGIFRASAEGQVIYSNNRWHEITGHSQHLSLDDWTQAIYLDDVNETLTMWNACLNLKKGGSMDMRWKNGTWAKIDVQPLSNGLIATITDISDRRLYEAAQLAAAQEREAIARQRAIDAEERQRESEGRRRAQELLVDVTSHELRQPVSAILNCSSLVRSNLDKLYQDLQSCLSQNLLFEPSPKLLSSIEEDLEALDAIYQCGLAQERIANDVLSLSRIQLQMLSIHPVDFDLVPEVQRTLALFSNELKMKAITSTSEFGPSLEVFGVRRVRVDKLRFAQVITNLMSNAIKFTDTSPPDRRNLHVLVEVSDRPPLADQFVPPPNEAGAQATSKLLPGSNVHIYVAVQDSGPGLKAEDLQLLFQRFHQGSNSHDVFGGSGLGLFVSRKLCELMGGDIGVTSQYGQGATFRFHITAINVPPMSVHRSIVAPTPRVHMGERSPGRSRSPGIASRSLKQNLAKPARLLNPLAYTSPPSPPGQTAYHVLITEDNLINQTVLNRQLKQAGFTTALANNGEQAIDQIKQLAFGNHDASDTMPRRFDVILMDCEMPVMDGLSAVREIRRMEASGELPHRNTVIALTGNARAGQIESAREAGMDDVVIKPYKLDDLLVRIRERVVQEGS